MNRVSKLYLQVLFIFIILPLSVFSQISYGGHPLPLSVGSINRISAYGKIPFVEMEPIDNQSALWRSTQDNDDFKSLEFAHKFFVNINPNNSGVTFYTADNIKVWRVGIRSSKAYSINILFSKFNIPEGAKLFVYNADQSEILGSFTHKNNSDINMLPIQPLAGDEIIVEYQEPNNVSFDGEIEIGEINHDFYGILRATEPRDPTQSCHPNLVCYPEDIEPGSGVVAIIINGSVYCTASLINNTENDGTPYLITATHCLNGDYNSSFLSNRKYDLVAGNIVAFFGYQSPNCDKDIRGNVQMSMASLDSVFVSERHDITLLRFKQNPPEEYQPYYLGWSATSNNNTTPYHGIHHPNGGIKKVAIENDALGTYTYNIRGKYFMETNAHWEVRAWDVAATEQGSSGSPLLDNNKRITGTLTGGSSYCSSPKGPDYYASIHKVWNYSDDDATPKPLQEILDPNKTGLLIMDGYNPYKSTPYTRSSNYLYDDEITQTFYKSVPLFATNNAYGYKEFAEEFYSNANETKKLQGVFITSPITKDVESLNIRIKIYNDNDGMPGSVIHEQKMSYVFKYYDNGDFHETGRNMNKNVENYLRFDTPITISGKFYIAYSDESQITNGFSVMNVSPRKVASIYPSTTWIKSSTEWIRSSEALEYPMNTSLMIAPYIIGKGLDPNPNIKPKQTEIKSYYSKESDMIFIESNRNLISWRLYDISGRLVLSGSADSGITRVALPLITSQAGVCLVRVEAEGKKETIKVLVR